MSKNSLNKRIKDGNNERKDDLFKNKKWEGIKV
jgi:hypothetical protein